MLHTRGFIVVYLTSINRPLSSEDMRTRLSWTYDPLLAKKPIKATELVPYGKIDESTSTRNWLLNAFKAYQDGWKEATALVFARFTILTGCFIIVGGTYSTILNILTLYNEAVSGVFSCADNSGYFFYHAANIIVYI